MIALIEGIEAKRHFPIMRFIRLIYRAFVAALLGSFAGAAISVMIEPPSGKTLTILLGLTLLMALIGFFVSLVALVTIGIPLSWSLREAIYRHPLPFAVLYGCLGSFLGLWIAVLVGLADQATVIPALSIGGATAVAWIGGMCRNRPGSF